MVFFVHGGIQEKFGGSLFSQIHERGIHALEGRGWARSVVLKFFFFYSQVAFTLLKCVEDPKELLFMWVISTDIYCVRSKNNFKILI